MAVCACRVLATWSDLTLRWLRQLHRVAKPSPSGAPWSRGEGVFSRRSNDTECRIDRLHQRPEPWHHRRTHSRDRRARKAPAEHHLPGAHRRRRLYCRGSLDGALTSAHAVGHITPTPFPIVQFGASKGSPSGDLAQKNPSAVTADSGLRRSGRDDPEHGQKRQRWRTRGARRI